MLSHLKRLNIKGVKLNILSTRMRIIADAVRAAIVCLESLNENMHFEVSFVKRFAFFPLNEVDLPKPMCHKQSFDIFKW